MDIENKKMNQKRYKWTSKSGGELYDSALDKHVLLVGVDEQIKGESNFLEYLEILLNKFPFPGEYPVSTLEEKKWLHEHPHCPVAKTGESAYCRINKQYYVEGPNGECPWCGGWLKKP
jgi:hypothetical protein